MHRIVEQLIRLGQLDDLAEIHHRDTMAEMAHHAQIMGDEQISQIELLSQILQQVDYLGLDRHVEGRDRLVADNEFRSHRQGPRDADALPLAAAHFVRITVGEARIETAYS